MLERVPIRWRLAGTSAVLTLAILCVFSVVVGTLTASRIHSDFNNQVRLGASNLRAKVISKLATNPSGGLDLPTGPLNDAASFEHAVARVFYRERPDLIIGQTPNVPELGTSLHDHVINGYYVVSRLVLGPKPKRTRIEVQYARPLSDVNATIGRVRLFLILGILGGTGLALGAGLLLARRAMKPIGDLTGIARHIAQTRDPSQRMPPSLAEDEVALLSHTLDQMLEALAASRSETEALLKRQRRFVADASHELRSPLTSVLANLELLAEVLDGEQGEAARSALRSSQRMRRLVADLLLLARADARRAVRREAVDLAQVMVEVAGELGAVTAGHELTVDAHEALVQGTRDDLHRMVANLIENAIRHTPPGTQVLAAVAPGDGQTVVLTVTDDGPGVSEAIREQVFERFVRGAGDRGGSFGLGLSIVRVVAEQHGGSVVLAPAAPGGGARFVVTLPAMSPTDPARDALREAPVATPAGRRA